MEIQKYTTSIHLAAEVGSLLRTLTVITDAPQLTEQTVNWFRQLENICDWNDRGADGNASLQDPISFRPSGKTRPPGWSLKPSSSLETYELS